MYGKFHQKHILLVINSTRLCEQLFYNTDANELSFFSFYFFLDIGWQ